MSKRESDWMWAEACNLIERAERLHRQFFDPVVRPSARLSWAPPMDMFETEGMLWIIVALPGVEANRIELSLEAGGLVVAGIRNLPREVRAAAIRNMEIPAGRFERSIELPPGRFELAERRYADGCLMLGLRKLDSSW